MESVDTQWLSLNYMDGMTASEWVQWGKTLNWLLVEKVNRKSDRE
jgi:hypothetical protein